MSRVTITIEDDGDEVKLQGQVEPEITADKTVFSTAEIIGLYMQSNMSTIMRDAISWAKTPDEIFSPKSPSPEIFSPKSPSPEIFSPKSPSPEIFSPSSIILPGAQL